MLACLACFLEQHVLMRALVQVVVQVCHLALRLNLHRSKLQGFQQGTSQTSKLGCMSTLLCTLLTAGYS